MKRFKHNFKKGMAFVLSLVMVAGLVPAMSGGANKVQAASGSGTKPSVSAYATKTQLMDGTFAPNADGTAVNYGKIVFGKKSDGITAQEWYILGNDSGVSGDNTIIFAASPIAREKKFNSSKNNKNDRNLWSDCNYGGASVSEIYANHYGASDLRAALKTMATNTSYFTTAEQDLMNATTVTTKDAKNENTYTTTDKLYALQGNRVNNKLWAGTSDSTVLAMSSYWSHGSWFWLRSPYADAPDDLLLADPGSNVKLTVVDCSGIAVQPASNLNLSSVLFASAATAGSSGAIGDKAMTLRFDGTGKNIGTVTYNATTGDIKATKGSTSQPVSLVVQGNDGTKDWYYSKQIAGPETVNASAIKSALGLTSDIDLSACKIWLEITDSTENLTYAVNSDISSVAITGIDTPIANTTLDTSAACATTGVSSTTPQITWTPGDTTAGYNTSYTASITLTADTGYKFVDSTTATINGNTATSVNKNTDGTLTVTYAFPATAVLTATEPTPTMGNYQIIDGANGKHTIGKDGTLTFRSNAPFSEFVAVLVDGVKVDRSNYDVSEGSTIVRLQQSFLDTLSKGSHTIAIQSIGGTATTNFSVAEKPTPSTPTAGITNVQPNGGAQKTTVNAKAPVTGETTPVSCMVLALIIVGGFALLIAELRKAHKA